MRKIKTNHYDIFFSNQNSSLINKLILKNKYSKVFILVDSNTNKYCLNSFLEKHLNEIKAELITIKNGEENKNTKNLHSAWTKISKLGGDRDSLLINLGGGLVSDLGGFVASTYNRGIDFINVPTTLLSIVDASIGGKVGINVEKLKNQVGVFNYPKLILIDTSFLRTLPNRELNSGYAEMIKHGLIFEKKYYKTLSELKNIDSKLSTELIYNSITIKSKIVKKDPKEKNIRKMLNFGHTLGHAIESHFLGKKKSKTLLHGEAIAVGMILESYISYKILKMPFEQCLDIKQTINSKFKNIKINNEDSKSITNLIKFDKKNKDGKVLFVLLYEIGKSKIDVEVPKKTIIESLEFYRS
ncbi:MAG: 3-dehydroquinate synthase [Flavobacteriaceae bacterium]